MMTETRAQPAVGIGYRSAIDRWTRQNLDRFDVLEITIDHCLYRGTRVRSEIFDLVDQIPLTAHGIGLSLGTEAPLDLGYLDQVAEIVDRLRAPAYSEHLAFTRVPGRDLAALLPLPQTEEVAEAVIAKILTVQSRVPVPFLLENISYVFRWPDSQLTDADFLKLVCQETGAGLLLDVENLYLNARNHDFNPYEFVNELPDGIVKEVHVAGGVTVSNDFLDKAVFADTHSEPVPDEALNLLLHVLARQRPETIVLERDDRLDEFGEILSDIARIRALVSRQHPGNVDARATVGSAG